MKIRQVDVEAGEQLAERDERAGAELADREGDRPERADRRRPHHKADDAEEHLRRRPDQIGERLARLSHGAEREPGQHRDEQHLQNIALGEGADEGVGDDSEQKLHGGLPPRRLEIMRDARRIDVGEVDIHAGAGLEHIDGNEPDDERDGRQDLEIDQRLQRDAADAGHVRHAGDAVHHGAENDRRDEDADRLDECVAERLHLRAERGIAFAERDAERHRHQYQEPELQIERPGF